MVRATCCALLLLAAPLLARQVPVFRSGVDVVTVDVSVVDDGGRPIDSLRPQDFLLMVDGKPRPIVSAEYVRHRPSAAASDLRAAPADLPHVGSNEHTASGRVILIAVDRQNIRRADGGGALQAASTFVDHLDPADRLAAIAVDDASSLAFTVDHLAVKRKLLTLRGVADAAPLLSEHNLGLIEALAISDGDLIWTDRAVQRLCGGKLGSFSRSEKLAAGRNPCPVNIEQQSRAMAQYVRTQSQQSIAALARLIGRLEDIEGPKTLVLLSEGLVAEPRHVDFTRLAAAAQRARVTLYVLHAEPPMFEAADASVSPTPEEDFNLRADGLARLAGSTGGARFVLVGTGERVFDRILRELSGYYLLGFEATASDRDGRPHRISVSVRSTRATVRARAAFQASAEAGSALTTEQRLVQLLRMPRLSTELPLRAATYRMAGGAPGTVRAVVTVETGTASPVTFGLVLVDERGVVATSDTQPSGGGHYSFEAVLDEGRYTLRAAAIEAAGRSGSLEQQLDLRLAVSGGIHTSDLLFAEKPATAGQPRRTIVDRTLADALVASLEIYGPLDADVGIEIRGPDDAPLHQVRAAPRRLDETRSVVTVEIALKALPPGRYVVTAVLGTDPEHPTRVSRSFLLVR